MDERTSASMSRPFRWYLWRATSFIEDTSIPWEASFTARREDSFLLSSSVRLA